MEQADLIWHNGELVAWEDAKIHVLTHGLHYGTSVFEGERAYDTARGTAIFRHEDHLKRLVASARLYYMDIPYTIAELRAATHELIAANGLRECYIRPVVYRGYGQMGINPLECPVEVSIAVWPWGAYHGDDAKQAGVRAKISSWRRIDSSSLIPQAKAGGQYLNSVLAKIESLKAGYEEAILLDSRGFVAEGTGENIYIVNGAVISTPPLTASILDGISRKSIFTIARDLGYEVVERDLARAELTLADEVFMTGTAAELVAVSEIDDQTIGAGGTGPVTAAVQRVFENALLGRDDRYLDWLDVVQVPHPQRHMTRIELYDTTLRDGMQGEGMSLSAQEKLRVAHRLDELGVDLIEAGFPSSNPKELELFELLSRETFAHAEIAAFGMTRRRGIRPQDDPALQVLADCFAPVCTLVGKTWSLHLEKVVKVDRAENLAMIAESVAFLVGAGKRVVYDAEHFFDGLSDDREYALACLRAAAQAGAETVVCCDTNGGSLPRELGAAMADVVAALAPTGVQVGIHTHDDAGCAVANTLAAVEVGVTHVQGTMNGYGERCGNANLISIIPNLQLKLGHECVSETQLASLTGTANFMSELLNVTPDPDAPYVGRNAFAHKGGMHVAGVNADPATFEHIVPEVVGNRREMLISELSGRGTVQARAQDAGLVLDDAAAARVVDRVKELEHQGYHFEAADGSFELLMRKEAGDYEPLFVLESWRCIVEKRADGRVESEATVKIWAPPGPEGERYVRTAEGNGPVNALDKALRAALAESHPHLRDIELVNFKVRILDETKGTDAVTRVLLDASDGERVWGSTGVAENVIASSWEALVDSLEYGLQLSRQADNRTTSVTAPNP